MKKLITIIGILFLTIFTTTSFSQDVSIIGWHYNDVVASFRTQNYNQIGQPTSEYYTNGDYEVRYNYTNRTTFLTFNSNDRLIQYYCFVPCDYSQTQGMFNLYKLIFDKVFYKKGYNRWYETKSGYFCDIYVWEETFEWNHGVSFDIVARGRQRHGLSSDR